MLISLLAVCAIVAITLLTAWYIKYVSFYRYMKGFPQMKNLPFFGAALEFPSTTVMYKKFLELQKELGSNYWGMIGMEPVFYSSDPNFLRVLLSSTKEIMKSRSYNYLHDWLGFGLLTSSGEKWRSRRKLVTPAFHFKILEEQVDIFNTASDIMVEKLSKEVGKTVTNIYPFITRCSLDIICETAMGTCVNAQLDDDNNYVRSVKEMGRINLERTFRPIEQFNLTYYFTKNYWQERRSLKYLHDFSKSVISERRKNFKGHTEEDEFGRKKKLAFLDLLLSYSVEGAHLSDEDIREEVDTFMFEGHDTTSSGISFVLYLLANHPKQQEKAFDEIRSIFGDDPKRAATFKDFQQMKYLELVIKEAQRIYPSVPIFSRELIDNFEYDGHVLPKGLTVMVMSYVMHRDQKLFSNPEVFYPERFSPEHQQSDKSAFNYIPFSAGPRNCIGQKFAVLSMKSTISKVLRNFKLLPIQYEPELGMDMVLISMNGILVKLIKRQW